VKPIAATPQATLVPMQTTVSSNLSAAAVPPTTDVRELAFVFNDKSWVEVKDATGEVIFAQNNAPGTRQVVSGKPPFDLVIGNAAHVIAQLDGKPIDLRPYTKVEVARLRVE
jgi:cytoskeleton protein RodZ